MIGSTCSEETVPVKTVASMFCEIARVTGTLFVDREIAVEFFCLLPIMYLLILGHFAFL